MPTLSSGKIAEVIFENALETYEHQMQMLKMVATFKPGAGGLQNAGNVIWRNVQQHAPILTGFDLSGQETEVIEETYQVVHKSKNPKQALQDLMNLEIGSEFSGIKGL